MQSKSVTSLPPELVGDGMIVSQIGKDELELLKVGNTIFTFVPDYETARSIGSYAYQIAKERADVSRFKCKAREIKTNYISFYICSVTAYA